MIRKVDGKRIVVHERFFYKPKSEIGFWVTYCGACENTKCKIPEKIRRTMTHCSGSMHSTATNSSEFFSLNYETVSLATKYCVLYSTNS